MVTDNSPEWSLLNLAESREIEGGRPTSDTGFWYDLAYGVHFMMYQPLPGWILLY